MIINRSLPSVSESDASVNDTVSTLPTTKLPVIEPDDKSAAPMPLIAYGTTVPASTLIVDNVKLTVPPSFTVVTLPKIEYTGVNEDRISGLSITKQVALALVLVITTRNVLLVFVV